ncbi:MAG: DUF190 domain-containing protein [Lentimicrobium sp.]|jgi:PII-like signaling protein|nr:DUF190 domain-containing protein [Lentimicrobium sp.]
MDSQTEITRLRIYLSSTDKFKHSLLSETIVFAAKRYGLAGATVFKGIMGFGGSSVVHTVKLWEISEKLPVIVEIVDETGKIKYFLEIILPWFNKITTGYLITEEKVNLVVSKKGRKHNN